MTALRRLAERLPELVEEVHSPLPLPEDPKTVLWVIKCPHWGAAPARFKDDGVNFVELCLAEETLIWLTKIRELNKELKQLYQAQTIEEKKSEGLFFWKQNDSSLIQTDIAEKKIIRSTLSDSKPLEMQWLSYPIDCY